MDKQEMEDDIMNGQGLEPVEILCSIAISLKRIADKLELAQRQPVIMNAEEYENYLAAKERYDIGKAAKQQCKKLLTI